jgi:RNA polymerase primary sigma factor
MPYKKKGKEAKKEKQSKTTAKSVEEKTAKEPKKTKKPTIKEKDVQPEKEKIAESPKKENSDSLKTAQDEILGSLSKTKTISEQELIDAAEKYLLSDAQFEKLASFLAKSGIEITDSDEEAEKDEEEPDEGEDEKGDEEKETETIGIDEIQETPEDLQPGEVKVNDSVRLYLREVGKKPLLKHDQEVEIAKKIEIGNKAEKELQELAKKKETKKLSKKDEEKESDLKEKLSEGRSARDLLAESNLRLVVANAKKYMNRGMTFLDLIQEGNIGLMKAIDKYDYTKGFKFSTYATWWIRQAISRAIADQARTIRMPVHMVELMNKINHSRGVLTQELGRDPTPEEISTSIGGTISPEKIRDIQRVAMEPVSFETPLGDDSDGCIGDFIEDKEDQSPEEFASMSLTRDKLLEVLKDLTEKEEKVIILRYGLGGERPMTLEEVGGRFGITRERVRQIESSAIKKMRKPTFSRRLTQIRNGIIK